MKQMHLPDRSRDADWAMEQFSKSEYAFVAVNGDDGIPYNVPLCLVCVGNALYFHTALHGHAGDLFRRDGRVCATCAPKAWRDPAHTTMRFRSAMAFGDVVEVTDPSEKVNAMGHFFAKYLPNDPRAEALAHRAATHAAVWKITVREAIGKENAPE